MSTIPASIFKYVTPARVDIITNERIAFTPPERFNDLLDARPQVVPPMNRTFLRRLEKEAQRAFIESLPPEQRPNTKKERKRFLKRHTSGGIDHIKRQAVELARKWEQELQGTLSKHFGVACFSEVMDEHLMWAHYADQHRGLLIEFDTGSSSFQHLGLLSQVEYLPTRPVYDPAKGAKGFWRQKTNNWSYEREWRIQRELCNCEQVKVQDSTIYLCPLARASIKSVCFGVRTSAETEKQVRDVMGGSQIRLYRARLDNQPGKLCFDPV
jgi:Protein of unknown function (DUF2971)